MCIGGDGGIRKENDPRSSFRLPNVRRSPGTPSAIEKTGRVTTVGAASLGSRVSLATSMERSHAEVFGEYILTQALRCLLRGCLTAAASPKHLERFSNSIPVGPTARGPESQVMRLQS